MRTSYVIDADVSGVQRAQRQADAALEALGLGVQKLGNRAKSAEASFEVFNREIDASNAELRQLKAALDPAEAALQRMQRAQLTLTRAKTIGNITAAEERRLQDRLQAEYRQSIALMGQAAQAQTRWTTATRGGAGGMQNFAFQLQDVFTQVGMGVPLMVSLGQQAPQILSGFGTVGAVLGVAAAAVLPLSAAFFGLGYAGRRAADDVATSAETIEEALASIRDAQSILRDNSVSDLDVIIERYGRLNTQVLQNIAAQNELALLQARNAVLSSGRQISTDPDVRSARDVLAGRQPTLDLLRPQIARLEAQIALSVNPEPFIRELEALRSRAEAILSPELDLLGIDDTTLAELAILENALGNAFRAENFEGALVNVGRIREILQTIPDGPLRDQLGLYVQLEQALLEYDATAETAEQTQRRILDTIVQIGSTDIHSGIAAGADEASRLAGELERAVGAAISLAAQGLTDVETARINLRYVDDPIGRAAALADANFNRRTASAVPLPDGAASDVAAQRRSVVASAVEEARIAAQITAHRKAQAEAARELARSERRGGGGGAGGARDAARERKRLIEEVERSVRGLRSTYDDDVAALTEWKAEALAALNPAAAGYAQFADDVRLVFQDRLKELYLDDLEYRDDWTAGIARGLAKQQEDLLTWADVSESIFTDFQKSGEDAFVSLGMTGKASMKDMADGIVEQLLRLSYQRTVAPAVDGLFDLALGAFGLPGLAAPTVTAGQSHAGSTLGGRGVQRSYGPGAPLRHDEQVTITTLGQRVFTPEQISNGATVVDALAQAAAGSAGQHVTFAPRIEVINQSSAQISAEMEEVPDGQGGRKFRLVLADEVGRALTQKGGGARRALSRDFGVTPRGTQR
ncbi:MAG: phage tail tape measure C-terminal domain-containing protein [Pseudomonadota bacterium]